MVSGAGIRSVLKWTSPMLVETEFTAGDPKFMADNGTIAVATVGFLVIID